MTDAAADNTPRRRRSLWSRSMILIRRVHLYAGLFLLPWVLLYGVTGAMYNHVGLFPEVDIQRISQATVDGSEIRNFPPPRELAQRVVAALRESAPGVEIQLPESHSAEFTSNFMFEVQDSGRQFVVEMDPTGQKAHLVVRQQPDGPDRNHIPAIHHISLSPDPWESARTAASQILDSRGVDNSQHPAALGWSKLNFLAKVAGKPVRITYVLKDGHIDIDPYTPAGEMTLRQFLLRMHTTHGQSPHWNGRMIWSLVVDVMALAMVGWAFTGIVMWWQIRRTRVIGSIVIVLSVGTAAATYVALNDFYATTRL